MGALARDSIKAPEPFTWLLRSQGGITGHGQVSWAVLGKREVHEASRTFWLEDLGGAGMGEKCMTKGVSSSEENLANPAPLQHGCSSLDHSCFSSYPAALSFTYF